MKVMLLLASLLVGLVVGVIGAFLQAARLLIAGWTLPWGLVVSLVALLVLIRGAVEIAQSRWAGWLLFAGWLAATLAFAAQLPSGALVISAGDRQLAYLIGGVVLGAAAATVPSVSRLRGGARAAQHRPAGDAAAD